MRHANHLETSETASGKESTELSAGKPEKANHLLGRREKELLSNREFNFKDCMHLRNSTVSQVGTVLSLDSVDSNSVKKA